MTYLHPALEKPLKRTKGVPLFREQLLMDGDGDCELQRIRCR